MEERTMCSKLISSPTGRMVRINSDSIFRKVDLEDANSIRRIMVGLDYYLTNQVLSSGAPELRALRGPERSEERFITNAILSTIRTEPGYPLLLEAVLHFIKASNETDQQVLAAARDLETLAPGRVLTVPQAFPAEYAAAEARFNRSQAVNNFRATHQNHLTLGQRVLNFLQFGKTIELTSSRLLVHSASKFTAVVLAQSSRSRSEACNWCHEEYLRLLWTHAYRMVVVPHQVEGA
jgi:hypothetical protein